MASKVSAGSFHYSEGVSDWRVCDGNEACVATWIGTDGQGFPT